MDKTKISLICPAYNAEKTLATAIESIRNQKFNNWELIIVDDGSIDDTYKIALKYSNADSRIKVVHQKNKGQAGARNTGLNNASGKWILFIDSDDKYEPDTFVKLIQTTEENNNPDIILFGFKIFKNGKLLRTPNSGERRYDSDNLEKFREIRSMFVSACNKMYNKEYITTYFDETAVYGEDIRFNYQNLKKGMKLVSISDCLYDVCLDTPDSVNKRYKHGRLCDTVINTNIELQKTNQIFDNDAFRTFITREAASVISSCIYLCVRRLSREQCYGEFSNAYIFFESNLYAADAVNGLRIDKAVIWKLFATHRFKLLYIIAKLITKFKPMQV